MPTDRFSALTYLRTPLDAPWHWEDNGRALVWSDGTTLAFREEIQLILERFTVTGAPPFTSVVCVLAACRGRFMKFPEAGLPRKSPQDDLNRTLTERGARMTIGQLEAVGKLPANIIDTPRGKALLVQVVLDAQTRGPLVDANGVLRGMSALLTDLELNAADGAPALNAVPTMHSVAAALGKMTPDALRQRLLTGIDALPAPIDEELILPRSERTRRLFAVLAESDEHHGLAMIVRDLMAAIRLPNMLSRFDEQALGGASGLINRGSLDRLLLSELAHDDLTLSTRVALNEALYVNREPPAHRPRRSLAVLLDTGLRLWGVPRVLATATALGLVSRWPDECAATAFNHDGKALNELDMLDAESLTAHLAVLNPALDPSDALPAFDARLSATKDVDVVIVTHRETVNTPAFRTRLMRLEFERGFIVLVDHDGSVELHGLPWSSKRPLAQVKIDVEQLFESRKRAKGDTLKAASGAPLTSPEVTADLPAIFREKPFPLLLPVSGKIECAIALGEGGICAMADRRLMQWTSQEKGSVTLLTEMPGGRTEWIGVGENRDVYVVRGRDGGGRMAVIILPVNETVPRVARFTGPRRPQAVFVRQNVLLLVLQFTVVAVSIETGGVLVETPFPAEVTWLSGRYFVSELDLWTADWGGAGVSWVQVSPRISAKTFNLLVPFDREQSGPWLLKKNGTIVRLDQEPRINFGKQFSSASINLAGTEIVAIEGNGKGAHIITVADLSIRPMSAGTKNPTPPARTMHTRLKAIYAAPGESLKFITTKDRWLEIFDWRLVEAKVVRNPGERMHEFETMQTPLILGCSLRVAKWPNGSRAWLDNRGLVHLRSHDARIPEVTLAVGMGLPLAAWTSDGHVVGPEFFTGKNRKLMSNEPVLQIIQRFCAALC